jgi:hypothetical protein
MPIMRSIVAEKMRTLWHRHFFPLSWCIGWQGPRRTAESTNATWEMFCGVLMRLGASRLKAFGLTLEDGGQFIKPLGFLARRTIVRA